MPIYKKHAKTLSTLKGINLNIFFYAGLPQGHAKWIRLKIGSQYEKFSSIKRTVSSQFEIDHRGINNFGR